MTYKILFILIFTPLFSFSAEAQFGKLWLRCKTDTDCLKVSGVCYRADAVNKKYINEFEVFVKKMNEKGKCLPLSSEVKNIDEMTKTYCEDGQCKLKK